MYMTVTGLKPPLMATRIFAECVAAALLWRPDRAGGGVVWLTHPIRARRWNATLMAKIDKPRDEEVAVGQAAAAAAAATDTPVPAAPGFTQAKPVVMCVWQRRRVT